MAQCSRYSVVHIHVMNRWKVDRLVQLSLSFNYSCHNFQDIILTKHSQQMLSSINLHRWCPAIVVSTGSQKLTRKWTLIRWLGHFTLIQVSLFDILLIVLTPFVVCYFVFMSACLTILLILFIMFLFVLRFKNNIRVRLLPFSTRQGNFPCDFRWGWRWTMWW